LGLIARYHKQGFGEELLLDALRRSLASTFEVGSLAVVVEAEHETAVEFYRSYGFIQFPDRPDKLFLPMQTIRRLLG
jgi:ribosomal protein S18 acetylase RimI-like enzyme